MNIYNCGRHDHNTPEGAQKCRAKRAGKRADRAIERSRLLAGKPFSELQVYDSPKTVRRGAVTLYVFSESRSMPYEDCDVR